MADLTEMKCAACDGTTPPLIAQEIGILKKQIPNWEVIDSHYLERTFKFKDFAEALVFVNKVGVLAESEGHHPDLSFGWGYVKIILTTHAIDGLSENDFIMAAKIDQLR